ncbi:12301_t:CDS:2 [Funneliformis geosporum]|nr:12301_t:CDS:2 [Funneliformis geosporum]
MTKYTINQPAGRRGKGSRSIGAGSGGEHYLQKDCEELAVFFNSIANIDNDVQELKLSVNEQEFNTRKSRLMNKIQECINKCQVSDSYSIASVCCIWNDYFGTFLKKFLDKFQQKLQSHLSTMRTITPKHQREILELETEIKGAETKYNDAMTKAATETDPVKKAQFIATAQAAEQTIRQAKVRLANNPLSKLAQYSYLNDLGRFINGNIGDTNPDPVNLPDNTYVDPSGSGTGSSGGRGKDPTSGGWTS